MSEEDEEADSADVRAPELRSFGRRRGRKLSPRQDRLVRELLPRLSIDHGAPPLPDLTRLFASPVDDVWLEIGFGGGEHLLWQARAQPAVGMIGCEPFLDGVVKVLSAIDTVDGAPPGLGNIRLLADDVRPLLRWLPERSIGRAFILFPDPWPKARHQKRRLVSEATLAELGRVLRPGAELRLATDIADYAHVMLLALRQAGSFDWTARTASDWRQRPADWPATRYEAKAVAAGRRCYYFRFVRR